MRRGALAGVVVAFALAISACGGGGDNATGTGPVVSIKTLQAAASNTQAAESSRFTMDMSVDASGKSVTVHAEGVAAGDGKTGRVTVTIPAAGTMEERIVDRVVYIDYGDLLGAAASSKLGGKHWVRFDLDAGSGGAFGPLADQAQTNTPRQGLEYLQGLSGDVEKVGDDTVAGRPATHYRAQIDYGKVAAKMPEGADRDGVAKLGIVPADVWIDDHDRVVRMQVAIDGAAFGGKDGRAELTLEITAFGVPVDVQPPPADDTVDLSALNAQSA